MNEPIQMYPNRDNGQEAPKPVPKKKRSKPTAPRAARIIEPEIAAINEAARLQRAGHRKGKISARILRVIIDKRLAQLTESDKGRLWGELSKTTAPPLPMDETAEPKAK